MSAGIDFTGLRKSIVQEFNRVGRLVDAHLDGGELRLSESETQMLGRTLDGLRSDLVWLANLMHDCPKASEDELYSYTFLDEDSSRLHSFEWINEETTN